MDYQFIGYARDWLEVRFWLELQRCPSCGEREIGEPSSSYGYIQDGARSGSGAYVTVTCPACAFQRRILYFRGPTYGSLSLLDPTPADGSRLGGPDPSEMIRPDQLRDEYEWARAQVVWDLSSYGAMDKTEWQRNSTLLAVVQDCASELVKFLGPTDTEIPLDAFKTYGAERERTRAFFTRAHLEQALVTCQTARTELRRVSKLNHAAKLAREGAGIQPPTVTPLPPFSPPALKWHEAWVKHGQGDSAQRMVGKGVDARDRNFARRDLTRVDVENSTLSGASFGQAILIEARLVGVDASRADFTQAHLGGAKLERCKLVEALLVNAALEKTLFTGCDLSGADLHTTTASADRATFVDCDLRGVRFTGREVSAMTFVNCKRDGDAEGPR